MTTIHTVGKTREYWRYLAQAANAPKATSETRAALVSQELGLSETDLEQFFYVNRRGSKTRHFDYKAFSQKYDISLDWLHDGYLPRHPRHLKPIRKARRSDSEAMAKNREVRSAIRRRIKDIAASRDLSEEDIKPAMTTKHFELVQFSKKHAVNIEWLLTGRGRIFEKDRVTKPRFHPAMSPKEFTQALRTLPESDQQRIYSKLAEFPPLEAALAEIVAEQPPKL